MEVEKLAEYLKQLREHKGVTLKDVEAVTRIPIYYLEILEGEGDRRLVSDKLFLIHFLRTYARFLELEPEAVVTRFLKEPDSVESHPPHSKTVDKPAFVSRALVPLALVVIASLIILLVYRPVNNFFGPKEGIDHSPSSASPAAPELPADSSSTSLPKSSPPSASRLDEKVKDTPLPPLEVSSLRREAQPTQSEEPQAVQSEESQPAQSEEPQATQSEVLRAAQSEESQAVQSEEIDAAQSQEPAQSAPRFLHQLKIEARERAWVRVIIDGKQKKDVLLNTGEAREWSAKEGFVLTFGNAGGVDLTLNGKRLAPVGASGQVIRNFRLPPADKKGRNR
jgi:cytoskeleton protein RodZ